jgi:homoserine kinase type II
VSVFTCITRLQLDQFFSAYSLGAVLSFEGIKDGIDNTNYFVTTEQGSFVLTLFESLTAQELPHFLNLLSYLGDNSLLCPRPQRDRQEKQLRQLEGKPAAIFRCLPGRAVALPSVLHCQEIGLQLASLHRCTQHYVFPIKKTSDLSGCNGFLQKIGVHLLAADSELINDELAFQAENSSVKLPQGVIHGDLFRDNVLFEADRLSGLLDFYSACIDALLLDVAIAANDWCYENGSIDKEKLTALLSAYQSLRPLESSEKQQWPVMLRAAALRFWLSRLEHQYYPRPGALIQQKDPLIFRRILLQHRQHLVY